MSASVSRSNLDKRLSLGLDFQKTLSILAWGLLDPGLDLRGAEKVLLNVTSGIDRMRTCPRTGFGAVRAGDHRRFSDSF
jgi:hypothetical protein